MVAGASKTKSDGITYRYANLSIEKKRYDHARKGYDASVAPVYGKDMTFSNWAMSCIETGVLREQLLTDMFPKMHFVGRRKDGGIVIQDGDDLYDITVTKKSITCSAHKGYCEHVIFATLHPLFID